jgi:hypothetical protein
MHSLMISTNKPTMMAMALVITKQFLMVMSALMNMGLQQIILDKVA